MWRAMQTGRLAFGAGRPGLFVVGLLALLQVGCHGTAESLGLSPNRDLNTAERSRLGLVWVLPGIEGESGFNHSIARGLASGGVPGAIRIYDWGNGVPGAYLLNLSMYDRNRARARELAASLALAVKEDPQRQVDIVAHAGGCAMALWMLEALPAGVAVDNVVLINPLVSVDYNLVPALQRVRGRMAAFYSRRDMGFLFAGPGVLGTMDRRWEASAGQRGFRLPMHVSSDGIRLYQEKLDQVAWNEGMAEVGNHGLDVTSSAEPFVRRWIAPRLLRYERPPPAEAVRPVRLEMIP